MKARRQLAVTWTEPPGLTAQSSSGWAQAAQAARSQPPGEVLLQQGDALKALGGAARQVQAGYQWPFLAHAPMEPLNCTAHWHDGELDLWTVAQHPWSAREQVAQVLDMPARKVRLHQLRAGGAFGRRLSHDFIVEAAAVARKVNGPVRVSWTREDDLRHDHFRGGGFHFLAAGLDAQGQVQAWHDRFVTFGAPGAKLRPGMGFGGDSFPAAWVPHSLVERSVLPCTLALGPWRSPGSNASTWVMQSFIDELAHAAGADPLAYRLQWLQRGPAGTDLPVARLQRALKAVAERGHWGRALPRGQGQGLAFHVGNGAVAATLAEVTVSPQGALTVDKVVVVVDVGQTLVNLSAAEAQVEGSVLDGLAAALVQQVPIANGRAVAANFDGFRLLRLADTPRVIDVQFLLSDAPAAGLGEPALPGVPAALCNAIFRACGVRVRQLPVSGHSLAWT
jgi:isoquinoline 1-oxidoreductase beta subunit